MRVMINVKPGIARENNVSGCYKLGEPIPLPAGKDIYITVPFGVFRCNINEGIFPEERHFVQRSSSNSDEPHVIRYSEIAHLRNPVLCIKEHDPGEDNNILVEFK